MAIGKHPSAPQEAFKPDYGLRMKNDGLDSVPLCLVGVVFFHIGVLGGGRYTTTVHYPYPGSAQPHALTIDFSQEHLDEMLECCPLAYRQAIRQELDREPTVLRDLDFPEGIEFQCSLELMCGELQSAPAEEFVPLVVRAVSPH